MPNVRSLPPSAAAATVPLGPRPADGRSRTPAWCSAATARALTRIERASDRADTTSRNSAFVTMVVCRLGRARKLEAHHLVGVRPRVHRVAARHRLPAHVLRQLETLLVPGPWSIDTLELVTKMGSLEELR